MCVCVCTRGGRDRSGRGGGAEARRTRGDGRAGGVKGRETEGPVLEDKLVGHKVARGKEADAPAGEGGRADENRKFMESDCALAPIVDFAIHFPRTSFHKLARVTSVWPRS